MKKRAGVLWLFGVLVILQLAIPLYMIWRWEDVMVNGRQYRWSTVPVDPYDALRGRYIDLQFKEIQGPVMGDKAMASGSKGYAVIGQDLKGYAIIRGVSPERPAGEEYLEVRINYVRGNIAHITLPFKRLYMREDLAPAAERAYGKKAGKDASVTVRVKDGRGVLERLYIGDQSIEEYLRDEGVR